MKRRFILLDAYERFTEKETLCLRESNFDEAVRVQGNKSKLIRELANLDERDNLSEKEVKEFNRRLRILSEPSRKMLSFWNKCRENRMKARSLSKQVSAVSGIQKAYGKSGGKPMTEGGLEGKA